VLKLISSTIVATAVVATAASAQPAGGIETKASICGACHGQNGMPLDPKTMPIIWGQQVYFLVKQLHDYRSGERNNPVMAGFAKQFTIEELRPLAAFFAAKQWPAKQGGAPAGEPPKGIAQCQACHAMTFEGAPSGPRLKGQSYEYLIAQMNQFANDIRTNNEDMPKVMKALSQADREAMAKYIAGL